MQLSRRSAVKALLATTAGGWTPAGMAIASEKQGAIGSIEEIKTEVCVIGGGSGGVGAALAAARAGARVLLIESESILGGTSTNAWVHTWEPTAGADGLPREIYERMRQDPLGVTIADYDRGAPRRGGQGLPFEPRTFDFAVREMLDETGKCTTLLGTTFCGTRVRGDRLQAVEAWFAAKRLVIEADVFIDCTADGDVSASAGCEYQMGEDRQVALQRTHPPENAEMALNGLTLCYRITDTGVQQKPYLPKGVKEGICPRPASIVAMPNGDHLVNAVNMIDGNAVLARAIQRTDARGPAPRAGTFPLAAKPRPGDTLPHTRLVRGKGYGTWTISALRRGSEFGRPGGSWATTFSTRTTARPEWPTRNTRTSSPSPTMRWTSTDARAVCTNCPTDPTACPIAACFPGACET